MFGFSTRGSLVAVIAVLVASVAALASVQAFASGGGKALKVPTVPTGQSPKQQAAQAHAQLAAHPAAAATNVHCGETITASTTLNGDLNCTGQNGLTLGKASVVLNLGGHFIIGSVGVADNTIGVQTSFASDTIEDGVINGFQNGVEVTGATDTVTKIQATAADSLGIAAAGSGDKLTSNTAAENLGDGIIDDGTGDTVQSNHALNNGGLGLGAEGASGKLLDNVADGNTGDGIDALTEEPLITLTGNVANFNGSYGITANSPVTDGGTNTAKGNTNSQQCKGVVCS